MNNFPLITILIPVYGHENLLKDSLNSSINQSYKNLEILVISDGSKKINTIKNIIEMSKDNRVKLIKNTKNLGVASVLNQGINISKGKFISWLSHDDIMDADKIKIQYEFLKEKKAKIVYSNFILFNNEYKKNIKSINLNKFNN